MLLGSSRLATSLWAKGTPLAWGPQAAVADCLLAVNVAYRCWFTQSLVVAPLGVFVECGPRRCSPYPLSCFARGVCRPARRMFLGTAPHEPCYPNKYILFHKSIYTHIHTCIKFIHAWYMRTCIVHPSNHLSLAPYALACPASLTMVLLHCLLSACTCF